MKELKSIILTRSCILIFFFFRATMTTVVSNDALFRQQISNDLLKKTDFDYYTDVLEKIIEFCLKHKIYVDLNMEYGLFVVDLNLRGLLKQKQGEIPIKMRGRLLKLLLKNNELIKYFHEMVHRHEDDKVMLQDIKLAQLFYNRTTWPRAADKFNTDLLKQTKMYNTETLEKMYGRWDIYAKFVYDVKKFKPSIAESDQCSAYLSVINNAHGLRSDPVCEGVPPFCKEIVENGSEFGYGMLHRLLLIIVARFSRQCTLFSKNKDKYTMDTFCMMAFNEAEYISTYSFGVPDLMFEQMALCGLLGHAQFFRNYWLKSLLQYQTSEGCFSINFITGEFNENLLRQGKDDIWQMNSPQLIMNGQCSGHFTSVAAASLSHAVRYILETYY